jgi:hypothetical protein
MIRIAPSGLMLGLLAVSPVFGAPAMRSPESIIAASKLASGGSAWDRPQGCYEEGTRANGAVPYKTWLSLTRYGMRIESSRDGVTRSRGFNGKQSWQSGSGGQIEVRDDADSIRESILTAYLSNNGFFFPDRFPARFTGMGEKTIAGRTYDVIGITPQGGRPFEGWFDRQSHLLSRVVDQSSQPPVTVEAGDYRLVGGLKVAFSLTVTGSDGAVVDRGQLSSFACRAIDPNLFDPPTAGNRLPLPGH